METDTQSNNLSKIIADYLNGYPYIKLGLKEGIINYSALARQISPEIEKHLSKKVNEESVMVAIKRYSDKENFFPIESNLLEHYKNMSVSLKDSMSFVLLQGDDEATNAIYNSMKVIRWDSTEFRFVLGSPSNKTIIMEKDRISAIIAGVPKEKILEIEDGLSLVSVKVHVDAFKNSNLITEFSSELSKCGISYMLLATPPEIRFLVKDENAQQAYMAIKGFSKRAADKLAEIKK
ncbi:MAG: hypothetical protein WC746_04320 [archaeon]|jgi:hypothetical protein